MTHPLYGTSRWKRIRSEVIAREPRCRMCRTAMSSVADHITPHRGDEEKFWKGPFQALCKRCHDSTKQRMEAQYRRKINANGWPDADKEPLFPHRRKLKGRAGTRAASPDFLRLAYPHNIFASAIPLVLVAGSPGAGKTTYVNKRAKPGDTVIDMDIEATRLGISRFTQNPDHLNKLLASRNERLRELAGKKTGTAWFSLTAPKIHQRWHFITRLRPKACVIVLASEKLCKQRIRLSRPDAGPDMFQAVERWHRDYQAHGSEVVIRSV